MVNDVSFFQLTGDFFHRDARLHHQHQHMVSQVADLIDGLGLVLFFSRNDDLGALLADFLKNLIQTLFEEVARVAALFPSVLRPSISS